MSTQIGGGGGRQRYGFQSLVRVVLNEHFRRPAQRPERTKFQSLVRVVLNEHIVVAALAVIDGEFQSLVRVVLNEHTTPARTSCNMSRVSIPRSGCAE